MFISWLSDHSYGVLSFSLFCSALFIPCFFAGVRDLTVGTDVMTYAYWTFYSAKDSDLTTFLAVYSSISAFGFNVLSWVLAKLGSFPFYLGVLQAFVIIPFCGYIKKLFPHSSWVGFAIYMLFFFPVSLNAMKQMIAVGLCLPTYEFIKRGKPLAFCSAILIISYLFHQTAIVALIYYPAVLAIRSVGSRRAFFGRAQGLVIFTITAGLFILRFLFGNRLVGVLSVLKESYSYQANASGTRMNYSSLVMAAGIVIVYLIESLRDGKANKIFDDHRIYGLISIIGSLAVQLNMIAMSLLRFSYYALGFLPLYGSSFIKKEDPRKGLMSAIFLIVLCASYFFQAFVVNGGNQIYPYTSLILGLS